MTVLRAPADSSCQIEDTAGSVSPEKDVCDGQDANLQTNKFVPDLQASAANHTGCVTTCPTAGSRWQIYFAINTDRISCGIDFFFMYVTKTKL